MDNTKGKKFDTDKIRYDLIPVLAEEEIARVFTAGSKKYGDRNWELGIEFSRNYAAARRHLAQFFKGEEFDSETQTSHLANAAVNIIMMLQFHLEGRHKTLNNMKVKGKHET